MERPYALAALLLAVVPWLLLLRRPVNRRVKIPFSALFLLSQNRVRNRVRRQNLVRAALRSAGIASLVLLWSGVHRAPSASLSSSPPAPTESRAAPRSILIVDGSDATPRLRAEIAPASLLELALSVEAPDATISRVASLDFVLRPDATLRDVDAALVVGVASLSRQEERALDDAARTGVSVVVWPGADVRVDDWNATFRRWELDARLLDAPLSDAPGVPSTPEERAFLATFPGASSSGIDETPCTRVVACYGADSTAVLRDRRSRAPVFSTLANGVGWFGLSPEKDFGALASLPAFPALVAAVTRWSSEEVADAPTPASRTIPLILWTTALLAVGAELLPRRFKPLKLFEQAL